MDGLRLEKLARELERKSCQPPRLPAASSSLASEHVIVSSEPDVNAQLPEPGGGVPQNNVLIDVVLE
jgi:hypothetical protein